MGNILITGFGSTVDLDVVTAEAGDIIAGKVIVDKNGNPLKGTLSLSGNAGAGDVRKGKTFYSTNPKSKQAGTMTEKGAATYTPGTSNQVIAAHQFLAGAQTILGDADRPVFKKRDQLRLILRLIQKTEKPPGIHQLVACHHHDISIDYDLVIQCFLPCDNLGVRFPDGIQLEQIYIISQNSSAPILFRISS